MNMMLDFYENNNPSILARSYSKDKDGNIRNETRYDRNGKEIYYEDRHKIIISEYYEKNLIHKKVTGKPGYEYLNYEQFSQYDKNGNEVYVKINDTEGWLETWYDYDENNNCIHGKNSNGEEYWWTYNEDGEPIHHKCNSGFEYWNTYDEKGNLIESKTSEGRVSTYEYDNKGNMIHSNENGIELFYEYYD